MARRHDRCVSVRGRHRAAFRWIRLAKVRQEADGKNQGSDQSDQDFELHFDSDRLGKQRRASVRVQGIHRRQRRTQIDSGKFLSTGATRGFFRRGLTDREFPGSERLKQWRFNIGRKRPDGRFCQILAELFGLKNVIQYNDRAGRTPPGWNVPNPDKKHRGGDND